MSYGIFFRKFFDSIQYKDRGTRETTILNSWHITLTTPHRLHFFLHKIRQNENPSTMAHFIHNFPANI